MHKFIPAFLFTILLSLFSVLAINSPVKKEPLKVKIDSSKIIIKKFNETSIKKYKADKEFNYKGEAVGQPSFWDRFWSWLWNKILSLFGRVPYGGSILKYALLGMAIALLIYIIIKSLGIDALQLISRNAKKIELTYSESLENIYELNFDTEIDKAISQHNYRLAVRLLYLKCLKQLSDKGLIRWQIDKTNAAYLYELTDPEQKQRFGVLTRQFEYIWYGDFSINKDAFVEINLLFQNFKNQLL